MKYLKSFERSLMSVLKTDQLSVKGRETLCLFSPIYRHCFRRVWWRKPGASPRRRNARLARVSGGITQEPERWSLLLKDVQGKCTKQILPLDCTHKHMQMHWRSQWITRAQCRNRRCWLKYLFKWIGAMKKQMQQLGAPLPHTGDMTRVHDSGFHPHSPLSSTWVL